MKSANRFVFSLLVWAATLAAQTAAPTPPVQTSANPAGSVTVTVSPQGTDVIKQTTGYTPKNASLVRLDTCNEGEAASVSTSRIIAAVIVQQKYGIYSSDVVADVLNVLQSKDVFTRARKIITAGANTATLLTALFKTLTPLAVGALQSAPAIAQAILPAVGDPRDMAALSRQILADNGTLALGKKGSGNDCHTGIVVAMSGTPSIATVEVQ